MKRILLIFSVICSVLVTAKAQVSVNYDQKTVAAMAGAYATETAAEAYYDEQVKAILKHWIFLKA